MQISYFNRLLPDTQVVVELPLCQAGLPLLSLGCAKLCVWYQSYLSHKRGETEKKQTTFKIAQNYYLINMYILLEMICKKVQSFLAQYCTCKQYVQCTYILQYSIYFQIEPTHGLNSWWTPYSIFLMEKMTSPIQKKCENHVHYRKNNVWLRKKISLQCK